MQDCRSFAERGINQLLLGRYSEEVLVLRPPSRLSARFCAFYVRATVEIFGQAASSLSYFNRVSQSGAKEIPLSRSHHLGLAL